MQRGDAEIVGPGRAECGTGKDQHTGVLQQEVAELERPHASAGTVCPEEEAAAGFAVDEPHLGEAGAEQVAAGGVDPAEVADAGVIGLGRGESGELA